MSQAEQVLMTPPGLPWAPCWRLRAEDVLDVPVPDLAERLAGLTQWPEHYWVLHQGPANPGSQRQVLLNLDSDMALASALNQLFSAARDTREVTFQCLPGQRAAGILFTRHPMRPDLDQIVVEGRAGQEPQQQRLILHKDGREAFASGDGKTLAEDIGGPVFASLAASLAEAYEGPRAAEWVWDGTQLWLVQALSVGTLPPPKEAWTRRAGLGFSCQAISPLWYTLLPRWLKTAYWRPLGERSGWTALAKVEPYRRQHSHLYSNGQFLRALLGLSGHDRLAWTLPPAWRPAASQPAPQPPTGYWRLWFALKRVTMRLESLSGLQAEAGDEGTWLRFMQFDALGERLAAVEGALAYQKLPALGEDSSQLLCADRGTRALLLDLCALAAGELSRDAFRVRQARFSVGADPVWPRLSECPPDHEALLGVLPTIAPARLAGVRAALVGQPSRWARLRGEALQARRDLAAALRRLLKSMALTLVERGQLRHPDDIFFLYFDELWQCWQGQNRGGLEALIGERKVRYLSDAHAGPPDWILDQVGYGASSLGQSENRDLVAGYPLVQGQAEGRVQRLGSGWQLNQIRPGDIVVLDQCEPGWLPWLLLAGGLVISHPHEDDPAVWLARAAGIPAVRGIVDAMHSLVDDSIAAIDGEQGRVEVVRGPVDEEASSGA